MKLTWSQWQDQSNSVIAGSPCPDERQLCDVVLVADHHQIELSKFPHCILSQYSTYIILYLKEEV